jgi:type II secretion system protein J
MIRHVAPPAPRPAFTLVELIVAAIITVLIAGATTTALSQLLRARQGAAARQQATSRAFAAADMIARDAAECARDSDLLFAKVQVTDAGDDGAERDGLLMLVRTLRRVRGLDDYPEGADFEVQYRVEDSPDGPTLWRRADPALDEAIDGGGLATPVSPGIVALSIEASDDQDWWPLWDSDSEGLPRGLRVSVTGTDDEGRLRVTARRVIALDRTPLPPPEKQDSGSGQSTGGGA